MNWQIKSKIIIVGLSLLSLLLLLPQIIFPTPEKLNVITTTQVTLYKCDKYTQFAISPSLRKIIYEFEDGIWLMDIDGGNKKFITNGTSPSFSTSSEKIAYQDKETIWVYELATQNITKIMEGAINPVFSPQHEDKIVYSTTEDINFNLWIYDITRKDFYQITDLPSDRKLTNFFFAPDGYNIFYTTEKFVEGSEQTKPETRDLWLTNYDATFNHRIIPPGRISSPTISFDSTKIAFYLFDEEKKKSCLWIYNLTDNETKLINCGDINYELTSCFSPTNDKIAATFFDKKLQHYKFAIFSLDTDTPKKIVELSSSPKIISTCTWADEETILYSQQKTVSSPNYALFVANFVKVIIDDEKLRLRTYPLFAKDEVFLPIKDIATKLDMTISYDSKTQKLDISHPNAFIELKANNIYATVNGVTEELDYKPFIFQGYFLVPAKFIVYAIGAEYIYDSHSNTVQINYKKKIE